MRHRLWWIIHLRAHGLKKCACVGLHSLWGMAVLFIRFYPGNLEFSGAKDLREIRLAHPLRGRRMQVGWVKNRRLLTNNWLYLENGTR